MNCDTTELCKELFTQILKELSILDMNDQPQQQHHHNQHHHSQHHEHIKTEIIKKPFRWG